MLTILAFTSIMAALFITMIAVGVQNDEFPVKATVETDLVTGFTSAANIVFTFCEYCRLWHRQPTDMHSNTQYLFYNDVRAQGTQGLSKIPGHVAMSRPLNLSRRLGGHLSVRR